MKIVDVNEFYAERGGGVRRYVEGKLAAAAAQGHDLTVIAPGPETRVESRVGGRIAWVASPPMPLDPRYFVLWNRRLVHDRIQSYRPDVVEGSSVWTSGWFAASSVTSNAGGSKRRPKLALFFHQDAVAVYPHTFLDRAVPRTVIDKACTPFWGYLSRLSSAFDTTIVGGSWLSQRLRSFGVQNTVSIPLGIDKQHFSGSMRSVSLREALLQQCGLGTDDKLLVAISRHHPEKRIGTLLQSIAKVNRDGGSMPRVGLLLLGDGPLRPWVERRAARVPHVVVGGYCDSQSELARTLASADGFLHGSAAETFGLVVAEAIAAGTPVVVPNIGGAHDLAAPEHAETYAPGNVTECAAAIARLLARDGSALRGACARFSEERIGTMEDHFHKLFDHYETLLST